MVNVFKQKDADTDKGFTWVDVTGPSRDELLEVAQKYKIPESSVRDCLEPEHLPKLEQMDDDIFFIIVRVFDQHADKGTDNIQDISNKIAIFYDNGLLVTIHRVEQDIIKQLKERYVDTDKCKQAHEILLHIVYQVLKSFEEPAINLTTELDLFESAIFLKKHNADLLQSIYRVKREGMACNRIINLTHDVVKKLTEMYKRHYLSQDIVDLQLRVDVLYNEIVDEANHQLNMYISLASQRTNETMRVLTIFSMFFMPLTFIVGVYGMNFDFMPELHWEFGYWITWGGMIIITLVVYFWFKRKGWL